MTHPFITDAEATQKIQQSYRQLEKQLEAIAGGSQGAISISDTPTEIGYYYPTESGTYTNAGGLVVDLDAGITILIFDGTNWGMQVVPVEANGVVEEGNTQAVSGDEVFKNLPTYIKSKNLFNPEDIQHDKYVHSSNVTIDTAQDWDCSALIPVEQGDYYLSGQKDRQGVGFYNESGDPVRYEPINLGLVTVQEGEYFVAFNLKSNVSGPYSNIQFERGSSPTEYEPYAKNIIKESSVNKLQETIERSLSSYPITEMFTAKESSNLLNPQTVIHNCLLNSVGEIINGTNITDQYNVTDFIKINPATLYTGLRLDSENVFRNIAFYDNESSFISFIPTESTSFTTPSNALYVRISIYNENHNTTLVGDMTKVGLFEGADPIFEYFGQDLLIKNQTETNNKQKDSLATIQDVKNLLADEIETNGFAYSIEGGVMNIIYPEGIISGLVNENRGYSGNDMFNFRQSVFKSVNVGGNDDVAPMHILNFTMGANHGYIHTIATIPSHGLTNIDIGTEFEKGGVKFYLLRIVDVDNVAFLSENSGTAGAPVFTNLTVGTITRGAETFTITERSNAQLYPSIGELNKYIFVNNEVKETNEDAQGNTDKLEVVENYVIYDPTSVLNNTIARAGQPQDPTMIGEPNVLVENIYRFVKEPACLVFANVQFLKEVAFADIMVAQAGRIGSSNATQYYVPNSNPLNGSVDLRKPTSIAWSSSIPSTFVINQDQPEPTNPPNRVIQYNGNAGFMLCYILTRGQGQNISDYTDRTFEIRNNTGKIYPHPVEGSKVGSTTTTDSIYSVAMARVYTDLSKTRVGNRLSIFSFTVDDEKHVYIDYSGSMIDKINLDDFSLNGKKIEVLESKNTILKNNIYNQGFVVDANYVEGETCYIVLMIK